MPYFGVVLTAMNVMWSFGGAIYYVYKRGYLVYQVSGNIYNGVKWISCKCSEIYHNSILNRYNASKIKYYQSPIHYSSLATEEDLEKCIIKEHNTDRIHKMENDSNGFKSVELHVDTTTERKEYTPSLQSMLDIEPGPFAMPFPKPTTVFQNIQNYSECDGDCEELPLLPKNV